MFSISIFAQSGSVQTNQFPVKGEPLLFHTGLRGMPSESCEGVCKRLRITGAFGACEK